VFETPLAELSEDVAPLDLEDESEDCDCFEREELLLFCGFETGVECRKNSNQTIPQSTEKMMAKVTTNHNIRRIGETSSCSYISYTSALVIAPY
jgi:hypothetical protein